MLFLIYLLTFIMIVDCAVLVFLVLIQLPKKEAGAGLAFGGSTTDALFGAGSGTVLTKITKYAATTFFLLAVFLSVLQSRYHHRSSSIFQENLNKANPTFPSAPPAAPPSAAAPSPAPSAAPAVTSGSNAAPRPIVENSNLPPTSATTSNAAAPPPAPK